MVSAQTKQQDIVSPSMRDLRDQRKGELSDPDHDLIASDRVEGTKVFRPGGERIGKIDHFMVDKRSGQVEYAVMSFGGFLGLGEELRPLPWPALDYDRELGGYVVSAEDDIFRNSPFIEGASAPEWDSAYAKALYGYWGVPY
ncbi:PRC-barrel domain-containing protein [Altererythrobacter sp. Z27]|uniref:PRC-barrel domain-containing protein n=1 Tax=Altererythrobacter sp. Z27 TaxID=3461147 RepID=UPI004044EF7F